MSAAKARLGQASDLDRRPGSVALRHGDVRQDGRHVGQGRAAARPGLRPRGILGTTFTGRLVRETRMGDYDAVVPTLAGTAWITGFAQYVVDPEDPFPNGFTLGDIWGGQGE